MKIYFAGAYNIFPGVTECDALKSLGVKHKLYSFYHEKPQSKRWGSEGLLLDSGAFSAWTKGADIDIDTLITFIKEIQPENAIQLDVIGDEDSTWENYLYMRKEVECLPVVHYRASVKHIERCFEGSGYVCLGGLVPLARTPKRLKVWLDYIYSMPFVRTKKVHCLGITSKWALARYPFYSVDSSSALQVVRYPQQCQMKTMLQRTKQRANLLVPEIKKILKLEKEMTELWTKRGITWTD